MNSNGIYLARGLLLVCGLLATAIAVAILAVPDAFYAAYEIELDSNVNLVNELKAPAGMLLMAGFVMIVGAGKPAYAGTSLTIGSVIYLSYGLSRLLSFAIDGFPGNALVGAAALELALGGTCLLALVRLRTGAGRSSGAGGWREPA